MNQAYWRILFFGNSQFWNRRIREGIKKVHPDVAISSLSQQQSVDVAANSTVSELDTNISDFVDKSIEGYTQKICN